MTSLAEEWSFGAHLTFGERPCGRGAVAAAATRRRRAYHCGEQKKSHFRPSDEMRMKKVDKDALITKIGIIFVI